LDELGLFGAATEINRNCVLVPTCGNASCVGSPCQPRVGCDPNWTCEGASCGVGDRLACVATRCTGYGACQRDPVRQCSPEPDPVCGCNGTQYDNACLAGLNPIDFPGLCAE
jgi:hypothetical protein